MSELMQRDARVHPANNVKRLWLGVVVSSAVALTACGGGGSGSDETQPIVGGLTPIEQTPVDPNQIPGNEDYVPDDGIVTPGDNDPDTGIVTPEDSKPSPGTTETEGTAKLSWVPPSERVDGEALSLNELGGYRIYYGTVANPSATVVEIDDPSVTSYTINGLSAASYSFSVTAFDSDGRESALSNSLSKTVN